MKIAMLYRATKKLRDHHKLAPGLYVRVKIIETHVDDLASGLDHVRPRCGEQFINCVPA